MVQSWHPNWLHKVALALAASAFGLLGAQCGTFDVNTQLVTSTPIGPTATFQPSVVPNTSTLLATFTATSRVVDEPTTDATAGPNSNQLGVPQLGDAQIIVDIDSHLIYRSKTSLNAARIFYTGEMQANGWTLASDEHSESHALLTFRKETETLTVELTTDLLGLLIDIKG